MALPLFVFLWKFSRSFDEIFDFLIREMEGLLQVFPAQAAAGKEPPQDVPACRLDALRVACRVCAVMVVERFLRGLIGFEQGDVIIAALHGIEVRLRFLRPGTIVFQAVRLRLVIAVCGEDPGFLCR